MPTESATLADLELEQNLRQYLKPGSTAVMSLYIVARPEAKAATPESAAKANATGVKHPRGENLV